MDCPICIDERHQYDEMHPDGWVAFPSALLGVDEKCWEVWVELARIEESPTGGRPLAELFRRIKDDALVDEHLPELHDAGLLHLEARGGEGVFVHLWQPQCEHL